MRPDFAALMCEGDQIDAGLYLADYLNDLIFVARAALENSDREGRDGQEIREAVARNLGIAEAVALRVADGYDDLARLTKRGYWRDPVST